MNRKPNTSNVKRNRLMRERRVKQSAALAARLTRFIRNHVCIAGRTVLTAETTTSIVTLQSAAHELERIANMKD